MSLTADRNDLALKATGALIVGAAWLWPLAAVFIAAMVWLNGAEPNTGTSCAKTFAYYLWLYQPLLAVPGAITARIVGERMRGPARTIRRAADLGAALPVASWLVSGWVLVTFVLPRAIT